MVFSQVLFLALLGSVNAATLTKRFSSGDFATGETDPNNPSMSATKCTLTVGWSYCVKAPVVPTTTTTTKKTATTTSSTKTAATTTTGGPSPTQMGLISTCNAFYYVKKGDSCWVIMNSYGNFTLDQFYSWNPAVKTDCSGLQPDYYVCVGVGGSTDSTTTKTTTTTTPTNIGPSPTQAGIATDCSTYYQAEKGDSCWLIVNEKYTYLTTAKFNKWNPAVGSNCSNLQKGYYYCVATKTERPMPNTISTCKKWHHVATGDNCWSIEQEYSISATQFEKWNPYIGSSCASLWLGYYVCVGV
ncbi:hypothetical protein EYZ11_010714 [Aspergillus tanneri]|uniref:LysM domain-containing protein n=1 Tax=Aspergillus tanneri TaxID=1220188 RepID=A0A4S3J4N3_9EURO|nr:hypothetical protein EYZ11_010714 [Aspergillus tanneri]